MPGYEALGYCSPSNSAFIVRADALQKCNWLPMYSRAFHLALGQELKLQQLLCHYLNMPLAVGMPAAAAAAFAAAAAAPAAAAAAAAAVSVVTATIVAVTALPVAIGIASS